MKSINLTKKLLNRQMLIKIVAAFRGMHASPAKHRSASVTDGQTDGQTTDKVIPMCRYASQPTQKFLSTAVISIKVIKASFVCPLL